MVITFAPPLRLLQRGETRFLVVSQERDLVRRTCANPTSNKPCLWNSNMITTKDNGRRNGRMPVGKHQAPGKAMNSTISASGCERLGHTKTLVVVQHQGGPTSALIMMI